LDDVTAFIFGFERHFKNTAQAMGWVGTTGWGEHAVLQLKSNTAVWGMHRFPMSTPIEWSTFCIELKAEYIQSNALDLVKRKWEELSLQVGDRVTEFSERFQALCLKLDRHQPMAAEMLADDYQYKIEKGNEGVFNHLVPYIDMHDRTPTLEQHIEYLAMLDTSLNQSEPGGGFNMKTNTTTKSSACKINSKKGGTTGSAGLAKDDGLTCYNSGLVAHISCNCPNRDMMTKLLEQALISKDTPKAKSGRPCEDKKRAGAPTGRKESGQLAEEKETKQETDSEAES